MSADPFNLERFVQAQDQKSRWHSQSSSMFEHACTELRRGRKESHWMWFIFPQIRGLGFSHASVLYAIGSRGEANAYLDHPILGPRLLDTCEITLRTIHESTANQIFGSIDSLKYRSSMTLFATVRPAAVIFKNCLDKYFSGTLDDLTLNLLEKLPETAPSP